MLSQTEFDALLQRYQAGHCQPGEQQLVEQWSQQFGPASNLPLADHEQAAAKTAMWRRIAQLTADEPAAISPVVVPFTPPRRSLWRAPALRWAAAAALTLGAGAAWWLPRTPAPVAATSHWVRRTNGTTHAQYLQLADGSRVTLATGSTLRYRSDLAGARREVYLLGQACFKVAKNPDRPFLVYTDKLVTTVLGTTFLVKAYAGEPGLVAVREGRVAVQRRQGAELSATPNRLAAAGVLLLPNQQATYSATTRHLAKALVDKPLLLTPQPLAFRNRPVAEVLTALAKAYGVNIVYDPLKLRDCTITIAFENDSLFEQLDTLCKALDASYKMANNAQIIFERGGGCLAGRT
ncbi:FecR family protein [Hymenobacter bucti]|uniref:FecR family protein n=1 Tax=Hymenobacter bucti TaxID=1844114 RepID=A0ABW4QV59_9BACT